MVLMYCANTYIYIYIFIYRWWEGHKPVHLDKVEACVQKGICCKIFAQSSMQIISISFISPS